MRFCMYVDLSGTSGRKPTDFYDQSCRFYRGLCWWNPCTVQRRRGKVFPPHLQANFHVPLFDGCEPTAKKDVMLRDVGRHTCKPNRWNVVFTCEFSPPFWGPHVFFNKIHVLQDWSDESMRLPSWGLSGGEPSYPSLGAEQAGAKTASWKQEPFRNPFCWLQAPMTIKENM